jgi:MoaA/NifB/PqqE/SkfB family radical SAM enzyme
MSHESQHLELTEEEKRNHLKDTKPYVYEKVIKYDERFKNHESIAMIQFQYDYKCNFSCEHCCITTFEKKDRFFTIEDVRELSRQADEMGLAQFVVTGGEPLVFPDLDELVAAIDPQKFHITMDTNGWFLDLEKVKHLREIGVDKIQLSLDSMHPEDHDTFRHARKAFEHAMRGIAACKEAGMPLIIATVVTHQRVHDPEFIEMLEYGKANDVPVFVTFAKPVGSWQGNFDVLATEEDLAYITELTKKYDVFTHLTPSYGLDMGCIAVKRMISITKYGDVMPCPYIHISIGNFFEEPLKDIVERGMNIRFFGEKVDTCLSAIDRDFIHNYLEQDTYGHKLPVSYKECFTEDDFIKADKA